MHGAHAKLRSGDLSSPLEAVMSRALHTLTITCQTGDVTFEFIADRPVLDYLSTIAERGTSDDEKLRSEQDLVDWINQSGILDSAPPVTQQTLERGKALREAMFRLIAALINHQTAGGTDCTLVNTAAEAAPPQLRLDDDGLHRYGDADAVFAFLARDCLDLFDSPDRAALRWCADAKCTRVFIDRSRGQRRRWCGMKGCGDRAKAAAYRRRQALPLG
jgi:predicted RNA-binding Zn ribbon-like protein